MALIAVPFNAFFGFGFIQGSAALVKEEGHNGAKEEGANHVHVTTCVVGRMPLFQERGMKIACTLVRIFGAVKAVMSLVALIEKSG